MRPIKFRAWNGSIGIMIYDVYLNKDGQVMELVERQYNGHHSWRYHSWPVMQFTGCYDKNEKWIYEGDIVKRIKRKWVPLIEDDEVVDTVFEEKEEISVVEYASHGFWIKSESFGWEGEDLWNWDQIEIIGNIYENPDLIVDGQDNRFD